MDASWFTHYGAVKVGNLLQWSVALVPRRYLLSQLDNMEWQERKAR